MDGTYVTVGLSMAAVLVLAGVLWMLYEGRREGVCCTLEPQVALPARDECEASEVLAQRATELTDDLTLLAAELRRFGHLRNELIGALRAERDRLEQALQHARLETEQYAYLYGLYRSLHEVRERTPRPDGWGIRASGAPGSQGVLRRRRGDR